MNIVERFCRPIRPLLLAGGLAAVLAGASLLTLVPLASAQGAPQLTSQITDQVGALGSGKGDVQAALDKLQSDRNVQLWVVLIQSGNGTTAPDLATEIFTSNGFGGNDAVLLIAVDDHRYGWAENTATGLPQSQIDDLLGAQLDPRFKAGDYSGGIRNFANALSSKIAAAKNPGNGNGSGSTSGSIDTSGASAAAWTLIAIIVIGGVIVGLLLWFGSWRRGRLSAEERDKQTGSMAQQANKLLVDTDDALRAAVQEIGFAQAQFEADDVKPFSDAVTAAQAELKKAFVIRQQLDDSTPEDQPTRAKMYGQIIAHCQAANAAVDEQAKRLDNLRDLEKTAPEALAALPKTIDALQNRLPAIQAAMKALAAYPPASGAAVKGNAEEADKRGDFAEAQIAKGKSALAETPPNASAAAHAARSAQEAVAQANQLLDAVEQLAAAMEQAREKLKEEIADADADVAAAKAAIATMPKGPATATTAADLAEAESLLKRARAGASAAMPDPIAALKAVQTAHAAADQVLNGIREASAQQARAAAAYQIAHQSAVGSIQQASAFVASRSDGVGTQARTRLAEAQRHLAQAEALAATDVNGATSEATTADQMADESRSLAQANFSTYDRRGGPQGMPPGYSQPPSYSPPPGYSQPTYGNSGGSSVGGAILGGIIGGMLNGGGRRGSGGGFGGTPWGTGGGWTGSGSSGGSSHSGSGFGGFGGSGGHSGGHSGSSGGGVHSGGGGW